MDRSSEKEKSTPKSVETTDSHKDYYYNDRDTERGIDRDHKHRSKVRDDSLDAAEKRFRVSDAVKDDRFDGEANERRGKNSKNYERRGKRKFEDSVKEEDDSDLGNGTGRNRRRFVDRDVKGGVAESSRSIIENVAPSHPPVTTKASSISTTNENKGVNIIGSHEVTGKSNTDGASTTSGKSGNLSLDALAKAKKTLQMQKALCEKLKKIPLLKKGAGSNADIIRLSSSNEEAKPPSAVGVLPTPSVSATLTASTFTRGSLASLPGGDGMDAAKFEAVKRAQELAAKMGFRQDPQFAPLINFFPGQLPQDVSVIPKPPKAPVLRLDALGREIDEHGNVVNVPKISNLSTLKVNVNKQKKDAFRILEPELEVDPEQNPHFDPRMGLDKNKILRPKKTNFQFVEEGKWSKDADIIKFKNQFGEAQAKGLKTKQAQMAKAKTESNVNPNLIEIGERVVTKEKPEEPIPEVEWWDVPILRAGTYDDGGTVDDRIKTEKITFYVEHSQPIKPPAEPAPPQPLRLKPTKEESKKLRAQQCLAREKDRQEMIWLGELECIKPKVKMSNLMKVLLGPEATQDPTRLEMEIHAAAAEHEQAHIDRNMARKLTPAERREKKERKLFDDPNTLETIVSVYRINDLSNDENRFKLHVNAHENRMTGCALIYKDFSVVVVEGGSKSIKRYGNLMLRRINWYAKLPTEDEERLANKCVLVWQGSVAKASFDRFHAQECRTEAAACKFFSDAGIGHYWDIAANFTDEDQA